MILAELGVCLPCRLFRVVTNYLLTNPVASFELTNS